MNLVELYIMIYMFIVFIIIELFSVVCLAIHYQKTKRMDLDILYTLLAIGIIITLIILVLIQ